MATYTTALRGIAARYLRICPRIFTVHTFPAYISQYADKCDQHRTSLKTIVVLVVGYMHLCFDAKKIFKGQMWELSGRVLDSRPKGRGFEPHWRHCVVSLSKSINPSLVLVQPRKTRPFIAEILLMGRKESNQTNKRTKAKCILHSST